LLFLTGAGLGSLAVGSMPISLASLSAMLFGQAPASETLLVETLRAPRTALGVLVGMSLGGAGALMQAITRSPLADPGLLGVNAGAATFVVAGICFFGITSIEWQMILAFTGAAAATLAVYGIGTALARPSGSPVPLLLAGIAVTAALGGLSTIMLLNDPSTFDAIRQWSAGSLSINGFSVPAAAALPIAAGLLLALLAGSELNALSLGDESATGLGINITRLRAVIFLAIALLCGTATAVVGPIGFVGLMAPHLARMVCGPDERWILLLSILIAPSVLILSDIAGRLLLRPAELQVGIVCAFVGAPVLIALARRRLP
jgi:iron complex transport system permease protein